MIVVVVNNSRCHNHKNKLDEQLAWFKMITSNHLSAANSVTVATLSHKTGRHTTEHMVTSVCLYILEFTFQLPTNRAAFQLHWDISQV